MPDGARQHEYIGSDPAMTGERKRRGARLSRFAVAFP